MEKESIPEVEVKAEQASKEKVSTSAIGNVSYWRVGIGPRQGDMRFKITGLNLATPTPFCIVFQSRQGENIDNGWADQFAIHIMETSTDFIRVRIRRIDNPFHGSGWGQNLQLNFIVRE
jgi:hypothetical protein